MKTLSIERVPVKLNASMMEASCGQSQLITTHSMIDDNIAACLQITDCISFFHNVNAKGSSLALEAQGYESVVALRVDSLTFNDIANWIL